ncbi:uncharacterized protein LOC107030142 [Solanum pennellii]|uniref:Uncharacterized protein LOC107030142 n=1 Tax=Solanum pennellii TaxID=28526 RepID=A0ABM1HL00_SOLPN|nr:uncharacterized protein LOC107030142 [Solanum pennellii]
MNPPILYLSKVDEDPQEFIDEFYKILCDMGLSTNYNAELVSYKLKDVAQIWHMKWRDNRPLRGELVSWEIVKRAFLDRFFPREMREAKVVEFINLRLGGMSVHDYSLKFIQLAKYAPSLVSDPRDEMSRFMTGVSDDLQEECHSSMLHDNMNIAHLMVHARRFEEARAKRKDIDSKRARSFDGGATKDSLGIQDKPKFNKRFSNQAPSKFPKARDGRVSNPKFHKGVSASSPT